MTFVTKRLPEIIESYGFIQSSDVPHLKELNRLLPMLVRCGGGRFSCPVQDVEHFVEVVDASRDDYVRDVSITADGMKRLKMKYNVPSIIPR